MVLVEQLDFTATDGHIDDAHPYLLREIGDQFTAKIIGGGKPGSAAAQGRNGGVPVSFCSAQGGAVNGFHHLKPVVHIDRILRLNFSVTLHVGLTKAEEDIKVFVLRKRVRAQQE